MKVALGLSKVECSAFVLDHRVIAMSRVSF